MSDLNQLPISERSKHLRPGSLIEFMGQFSSRNVTHVVGTVPIRGIQYPRVIARECETRAKFGNNELVNTEAVYLKTLHQNWWFSSKGDVPEPSQGVVELAENMKRVRMKATTGDHIPGTNAAWVAKLELGNGTEVAFSEGAHIANGATNMVGDAYDDEGGRLKRRHFALPGSKLLVFGWIDQREPKLYGELRLVGFYSGDTPIYGEIDP